MTLQRLAVTVKLTSMHLAANPCVFGTGWSCMVMQAR